MLEKYLQFNMYASANIYSLLTFKADGLEECVNIWHQISFQQLSVQSLEQMSIWVLFTDNACVKMP